MARVLRQTKGPRVRIVRVADFEEVEYGGMMGKVEDVLYHLFPGNAYVISSKYMKKRYRTEVVKIEILGQGVRGRKSMTGLTFVYARTTALFR
jgi:hypothetical protein